MRIRKKTWQDKVNEVQNSYGRAKNNEYFARYFYKNLFFLNPKIEKLFENTDFEHQEKALLVGINVLLNFLDTGDTYAHTQIVRLAKVHSATGLAIHPHYYYYWIEALIMTLKQTDRLWHDEMHYYWREIIMFPITFIISQYYQ